MDITIKINMSKIYQGIILKVVPYKESDAIVTLLTKEEGFISFKARGVFKINSKNASSLQLYTIGEYKSTLKERQIDYKSLMVKRRCTQKHRDELATLMNQYIEILKNILNNSDSHDDNTSLISTTNNYFKERAKEICPNDDERINILLELCYGDNNVKSNKEFCWMIVVDLLLAKRGMLDE